VEVERAEAICGMGGKMKRIRVVAVLAIMAAALSSVGAARADTHAPSAQTFALTCGGVEVTFVSPSGPAEAAQIVDMTGVGILQQITDSLGNVLFEHPAFRAHKSSALTTCYLDGFRFVVMVTLQAH
jgi:hypothetical protein